METPIIANLPRGYRMDRQLGVVYDSLVVPADDLTRVDGIRTREAVLLNQLGIYYYGQLALWRHREMTAISSELQIPIARIVDEAWIDQARHFCTASPVEPIADLPSTVLRTVSLLACALLIGFFGVYLLGRQRNEPLPGVLSADITSIRVPAMSRLTEVLVKPGQEVFSGQPLLTFEKVEHLKLIEQQEAVVRDLERELKRAEAQAAIELEWRMRDLDHEVSSVLRHISANDSEAALNDPLPLRTVSRVPVRTVSASRQVGPSRGRSGGLIFFGASGQKGPANAASVSVPIDVAEDSAPVVQPAEPPVPQPKDLRVAEAPRADVQSDSVGGRFETSGVESLRTEHQRLESLRSALPETVSEAVGVISLKARFADASRELEAMKSVSREVNVTAPVYGIVGQVRFQPGDTMESGEVLLRILHTDRRYVVVHLPTRRVHEMQSGMEVELSFPGGQQHRGIVSEIPMLAETSANSGESIAKVRIDPVGRLWPSVPVGSQVDVISLR